MSDLEHAANSILDQAEDWLIILQSDEVSDFDRRRFRQWLNANSEHQRTFDSLLQQWNCIPELIGSPAYAQMLRLGASDASPTTGKASGSGLHGVFNRTVKSSRSVYQSYSPVKLSALAASFILFSALCLVYWTSHTVHVEHFRSGKGEIVNHTLTDGSVITLSADSVIEARISNTIREITLASGQAFFKVSKDEKRPFFVLAGEIRVRVVGTEFDINKSAQRIRIAVREGVVEASKNVTHETFNNKVSTTQITLTRGQVVNARNSIYSDFDSIATIPIEDISPWQAGRLRYNNVELAEITADANRFYPHNIALASEELGELKVTASFRINEIEKTLEDLAAILPIKIHKDANQNIVIMRAPERG